VNAGRIAADALAEAITKSYADTEGDIAVITSMPGLASLDQRAKGFKDEVAAKYRALNVAADKVADGKPASVREIMNNLIAKDGDLRGVVASDPSAAEVVAQAVSEGGYQISIVTFGSDENLVKTFGSAENLVKLLQSDVITGIVVEDPFRMGYDGVKTALAASNGEPVPAYVDTGATLVTKANLSSTRSQELLNPKVQ
jgi:ribose transport system substrate-binding protein